MSFGHETNLSDLRNLARLSHDDLEATPLEEIAFLVAKEKYPSLDMNPYRERLLEFADRAYLKLGKVIGGRQVVAGLSQYLFEDEGFRGNTADYYHPANSFFNDVLDSRQGIPITLSILYIVIGKKLGLPLTGVGFPGHFLVRYEDEQSVFFIDPFHRGKLLTEADCRHRFENMYGNEMPFQPEFLNSVSQREMLIRLLSNLKMIYMIKKDFTLALQTLNSLLLFNPQDMEGIKERGLLYYHLECFGNALKDLKTYLSHTSQSFGKSTVNPSERLVIEECIADLKVRVLQIQ